MIPIVILASGRGSNFDAIHQAIQKKELDAEILAVISDQPDAAVLQKASDLGLRSLLMEAPKKSSRLSVVDRRYQHEELILDVLKPFQPRFLVMAGYMRIVTPLLIEAFRSNKGYSRVVNIHPSILPAFPGVHSYAQAFQYGAKISGVTVHLVEDEVDRGPICAQEAFSIAECQSEFEVEQKGLAIEHRLYPSALAWILPEKFSLSPRAEGRLSVSPN